MILSNYKSFVNPLFKPLNLSIEHVIIGSRTQRTMKRLCLYSATGIHGVVPKTEPRRAAFNAALKLKLVHLLRDTPVSVVGHVQYLLV